MCLGSLAWDLAWDPWLGTLGLGLRLRIFGFVSLALDLWLGILGFGSLALDRWLGNFGLGAFVWDLRLGNLDPKAGERVTRLPELGELSSCLKIRWVNLVRAQRRPS